MRNFVFAANEHIFNKFLFYFQLKPEDYTYVSYRDTFRGFNHLNAHFILTDGYVVNPGFATDRYMMVVKMAKEDGKMREFVEKKLMSEVGK